jgi:type IX secretion system PorP/SprF family membrane protein
MKQLFTLAITSLSLAVALAQQPAQYSMFMLNKFHWNPAYAGLDHSLSATGVYRAQWDQLEGNPITQNINVHAPLYIFNSGLGLNLENDELGLERRTTATVAYNYQLTLGRKSILALGLSGGLAQRTLDGSKMRTPEGNYTDATVIFHNDDLLPISMATAQVMTFGAGAYFYSENFQAGLAVRNLNRPQADLDFISLQLSRAFFFTADARFELGQGLSLHPSILLRSDLVQTQTDLGAIFRYNDNIFAGASFRGYNSDSVDALAFIAGFKLSEKTTLAYAYDMTLSILNQVSNGSHELMLNYNLNKPIGMGRPPRVIYNPRAL